MSAATVDAVEADDEEEEDDDEEEDLSEPFSLLATFTFPSLFVFSSPASSLALLFFASSSEPQRDLHNH